MNKPLYIIAVLMLVLAFAGGTFAVSVSGRYVQVNLTADAGNAAPRINAKLADPWGIARAPDGEWWIANRKDGILLRLNGQGGVPGPKPDSIAVPLPHPLRTGILAKPTGVVYNQTADFVMKGGKPARIITATQQGIIAAWNRNAGDHALIAADNSSFAVYTGITIGRKDGKNYLYAADFRTGTIDVFDTYFHQIKPEEGNRFVNRSVPRGFVPFNVLYLDGKLYVLYAYQDSNRYNPEPGVAGRYVSVYDMSGKLLKQFAPGRGLNSAWGMSKAPAEFGGYSGMLLLGNSADGTIAALDPHDGRFRGFLETRGGHLVTIPGLRGMAFDKAGKPGRRDRLYFCAGIEAGEHALFGFVAPAPVLKRSGRGLRNPGFTPR